MRRSPASIWPGVWLLAAAHLSAFADRFLTALVAPAMKADLGLTDFQLGLVQGTAFVSAFVVASALGGPLVDRAHRPRLVAASLMLWSCASIGCGLATGLNGMMGARMMLGLGQSCLTPAALSLIAARTLPARRGRTVSIYTAGATLGRSAALLAGGGLLAVLPVRIAFGALPLGAVEGGLAAWRAVFILGVLPNLALAALILRMPDAERTDAVRIRDRPALRDWLARHAARYAAYTLAAAAAVMIIQSLTAWTTMLYVRRFGLSIPAAGGVFGTVVAIGAPAGHLVGGLLVDRLASRGSDEGRRADARRRRIAPALVLGGGLLCAPPLTAAFALATDLTVSLGALGALVFVLGLTSPAALAGLQAFTPRGLRGRVTALFVALVTAAGFGIGPPLVGLLTDRVLGEAGIGGALTALVGASAGIGLLALAASVRAGRARRPAGRTVGSILWTHRARVAQVGCADG